MHHHFNYSSALDVCSISLHFLKNEKFRDIVNSPSYTCLSRINPTHRYKWENTNKLLELGYSGLKTGVTPTAGPCLAASL